MSGARTSLATGRLNVPPPETLSMTLRDGTRLDADVYRPDGPGPYPVLLQRQSYSRRIACTICYAHPAWYASHGFIVVVQDVRGRGTSEGSYVPGENEVEDGAEAVEWAAALPGSSGKVGMYGFSYQGLVQLAAAAGDCPSLAALAPAMALWDAAGGWVYENGALRMRHSVNLGLQLTAEAARRAGDEEAYGELTAASGALPFNGPVAARPAVLQKHRALSHVMDWIETPAGSPYWATISPAARAEAIRARGLPMFFIGGWFDTQLTSTVAGWRALVGADDAHSRLVIGPWLHFPWTSRAGDLDFGPEAATDMDDAQIRFFKLHLAGEGEGVGPDRIRLFDMGSNKWVAMDGWPSGRSELFLGSRGRASIDLEDGTLAASPGGPEVDYLVHDPWRPAPVTGGCYGTPPGPVNRAGTDRRGDVLTFTTDAFESDFTVAGDTVVELTATGDRQSFDLGCVLSRVTADGRAYQIASGYAHFRETGGRSEFAVPLSATLATIRKGERLRLSVSAAAFPAYPVNPGTGTDPAATPKAEGLVTTVRVAHGQGARSLIRLGRL